ncbi:uncharacterized protein LOC114351259 [Ostrinia furnacalis]|uniref:uncharacterized protein LOC114351259 n=1 Tax=Ostrinia furnacalis TaxID=93504 RepID=UPI00103CA138|nr:uncharacterized protein LOC114351259 [Ostrinia furnacalis]
MSKRKVFNSEGRGIIAKVYHFLQEEYQFLKTHNSDKCDLSPLANITKRTAEATGASERTISRILKEEKELPSPSSKFSSPMKKRRKRDSKFDFRGMDYDIIRTTIQSFYIEHNEKPTLAKLQSVLKEKIGFDGCMSTLYSLLKKMGYKWNKIGNTRKSLQERHEIQLWRLRFLKTIQQCRSKGRPIVYTDETYVLNKDKSFIVAHAGTSSGFISGAFSVYKAATTTGDVNFYMNFDTYVKWLNEMLLPNLPENSVIVMDNAVYHNARSSKIPTLNHSKDDMQKWLKENDIYFDEQSHKLELYNLIKENKKRFVTYHIDEIVKSKGFEILRLPPNHPELNAIENIWDILKTRIDWNDVGQNLAEVKTAILKGLESIDANIAWHNACKHVEKIEKEYMKYYDFEFDTNLAYQSGDSDIEDFQSDSDSENEYGVEALCECKLELCES